MFFEICIYICTKTLYMQNKCTPPKKYSHNSKTSLFASKTERENHHSKFVRRLLETCAELPGAATDDWVTVRSTGGGQGGLVGTSFIMPSVPRRHQCPGVPQDAVGWFRSSNCLKAVDWLVAKSAWQMVPLLSLALLHSNYLQHFSCQLIISDCFTPRPDVSSR